ncbi:hypothetical protein BVRB_7g174470 [Beta vulgaris subsp. vulgaris]|nr:hypothetical protein BVRB_7g174470 [Beta vulgaris subsp. vulgaris]
MTEPRARLTSTHPPSPVLSKQRAKTNLHVEEVSFPHTGTHNLADSDARQKVLIIEAFPNPKKLKDESSSENVVNQEGVRQHESSSEDVVNEEGVMQDDQSLDFRQYQLFPNGSLDVHQYQLFPSN